ncbi:hypothetical protein HBH87_113610 [Parastagonospora nodorum]|nr:hypothetical protein HBH87_113610 [Parastagonospora nodorum]
MYLPPTSQPHQSTHSNQVQKQDTSEQAITHAITNIPALKNCPLHQHIQRTEDDCCRNPGPEFVCVHNLVAKHTHDQGAERDGEDISEARYVVVHRIDQLARWAVAPWSWEGEAGTRFVCHWFAGPAFGSAGVDG